VSKTPETDAEAYDAKNLQYSSLVVDIDFAQKLERERDQYRRNLELIAEDCEAWLNSESDEPSAEFIKLVAKYAREAIK
jgi:hypothetical protein